ncbi:hypothetical protein HAX54_045742, partial [Datura stramonium]|nr:hypothetical protein [Datura stramonium]
MKEKQKSDFKRLEFWRWSEVSWFRKTIVALMEKMRGWERMSVNRPARWCQVVAERTRGRRKGRGGAAAFGGNLTDWPRGGVRVSLIFRRKREEKREERVCIWCSSPRWTGAVWVVRLTMRGEKEEKRRQQIWGEKWGECKEEERLTGRLGLSSKKWEREMDTTT